MIDEHARKHDAYIQRYLKTRQSRIVSQPGRVVPFTKLDGSTQDIFIFVDETEFNGTFGFKGEALTLTLALGKHVSLFGSY